MPAVKRLLADQKGGAALGRKQAAGRSQQGAIARRVPGPLAPPPEDRQLVAQHDDLELPLAGAADDQAENNEEQPVEQRHQHDKEV